MTRMPCIHTQHPTGSLGAPVSSRLTQSCSGFTLAHPRLTHFLSLSPHAQPVRPPNPSLKSLPRHPTHTASAPSPIYTHAKLNMLLTIFNASKLNLLKCNYLRRLAYCKWVSFIAFAVSLYLSRQFKDATESVPCQWGHVQLQRQ